MNLIMFSSKVVSPDMHKSWVLNFVGVPQPKPMHGFSPNYQDMFTPS